MYNVSFLIDYNVPNYCLKINGINQWKENIIKLSHIFMSNRLRYK